MADDNLLMVADSDRDPDMLYAVGMFVPDPFLYLRLKGKNIIVMSDLELDRARRKANGCHVVSLSRLQQQIGKRYQKRPDKADIIEWILKQNRVKKVTVPPQFPHSIAVKLQERKLQIRISENGIFPERAIKTAAEVRKISAALTMAEVGLSEGIQVLRCAKIDKRRRLIYRGVPLTSEKLRSIINTAIFQAGGVPNHTIVAGGKQGCDPHEAGHGVLRAHEPILLDIFPRSQKTGYYGDITRTVVKGKASEALRALFHTVIRAQELAFEKITHDRPAREVHETVQQWFKEQGYKTVRRKGRWVGFFHGTAHGLGLELHEKPWSTTNSQDILQAGQVLTVEPGLYYPELGGIRLEDVVRVTRSAPRNLTKFEKVLEI